MSKTKHHKVFKLQRGVQGYKIKRDKSAKPQKRVLNPVMWF